jgi:hypothetical protein
LLSKAEPGPRALALALPEKNGRDELAALCLSNYSAADHRDTRDALASAIMQNAPKQKLVDSWIRSQPEAKADWRPWLQQGLDFGVLAGLPVGHLIAIAPEAQKRQYAFYLIKAERYDVFAASADLLPEAIEAALDRGGAVYSLPPRRTNDVESAIRTIFAVLTPYTYNFNYMRLGPLFSRLNVEAPLSGELAVVRPLLSLARRLGEYSRDDWRTSIAPWNEVVEGVRKCWGDRNAVLTLALMSGGIRSRQNKGVEAQLADSGELLCERVRHARLRAGNSQWWRRQLIQAADTDDSQLMKLTLMTLATWASARTLADLGDILSPLLDSMDDREWHWLDHVVRIVRAYTNQTVGAAPRDRSKGNALTPRLITLIGLRVDKEAQRELLKTRLKGYGGSDRVLWQFIVDTSIVWAAETPSRWRETLRLIEQAYRQNVTPTGRAMGEIDSKSLGLSPEIAQTILDQPELYPLALISVVENSIGVESSNKRVSIATVAKRPG